MTTSLASLAGSLPTLTSPADISAATTYTDLNGLEALKKDPSSPQALGAVAQQVEALFLQMMLRSMRDANAAVGEDDNEMSMYQDMFDKQVALTMSQHQDLGIGAILKRQLSNKVAPAAPKTASAGSAVGAVPGAAQFLAQTPAEFVDQVMPAIRRAAGALGVNPLGLLAQAALETGWGQRMPRTAEGSPSLNLFGIKAGEEWTGARATADTLEFSNGVATPRRTAFRAYGSIEESVSDFANLLKNSPRYRDALAAGGDTQAYIERIGKSGYATDPGYANKLNQILNSSMLRAALPTRTAAL
jgi:peptidoglycan hydrolase FlgJ